MLTWLRANVMTAAALVLAVLFGLQTWLRHTEQLEHRDLIAKVAQDKQAREKAAREAVEANQTKQDTHATASQENASELLETLSRQRDAALASATRHERLQHDAEKRAATFRAMRETDADTCRDLVDRYETLDRNTVEGVRVVDQLREVVERRDAEVKALMGQINADRALFAQPSRPDGGTTEGKP